MSLRLTIRNRQKSKPVDLRLLQKFLKELLSEEMRVAEAELGIFLVDAAEMTRLNETFLQHQGSTDVITFSYSEHSSRLHGEIFICLDEAIIQARRFRTSWQSELIRYLVHGVLHLLGHDDRRAVARRKMKLEEDRLVRSLSRSLSLRKLAKTQHAA